MSALGYVQQGYELWRDGVEAWQLQLAGFLLFVGTVITVLYRWDQERSAASPTESRERPGPRAFEVPRVSAAARALEIAKEEHDPDWESKLEIIEGRHFQNCEVRLDGKKFVGCRFSNVTFVHNGGSYVLNHIRLEGSKHFLTERPDIRRFVSLLIAMGAVNADIVSEEGNIPLREFHRRHNIDLGG